MPEEDGSGRLPGRRTRLAARKASEPLLRRLRVLAVDDSAVVRQAVATILTRARGFEVTTASDPLIAMEKIGRSRPDVILLDLEMPRMDGLTFLRKLREDNPIPVVVCSALTGRGTDMALRALEEGALEVVTKPRLGVRDFLQESAVLLADALRAAAGARPRGRLSKAAAGPVPPPPRPPRQVVAAGPPSRATERVVAVGASTGGTEALRVLLQAMPSDCPGIVIVQHMPEGFTHAFAENVNRECAIEVREASDGDRVLEGLALIAPGNRHLEVVKRAGGYEVRVREGPLVSRHRPSVDVLFRSVAQAAKADAVGVIMTGMGADGAEGLLQMRLAGAATMAQDEATCVVFGMPREAIDRGAAAEVVPLERIPGVVLSRAGSRRRGLAPAP